MSAPASSLKPLYLPEVEGSTTPSVYRELIAAARSEAERELDRAIAEYYDGLSSKERAEDASWARLSTQSFMVREQRVPYEPKRSKKKGVRR